MRTTIDLDPLALGALRDLATVEKRSIGKVAGDLVLLALRHRETKTPSLRNGIRLLARDPNMIVTNELIEQIREKEGV